LSTCTFWITAQLTSHALNNYRLAGNTDNGSPQNSEGTKFSEDTPFETKKTYYISITGWWSTLYRRI